jgi:FkbM family methyltransferase
MEDQERFSMAMLTKSIRIAKITLVSLLAIAGLIFAFSRVNRPATVRTYFRLETAWIEHYPRTQGKWTIQRLVPILFRIGVLGPARIEIEPGVSVLLDPRDLVPATILRTGEWQPEIWESISPALSEGSVFLDVGAHIGYFSLKAAIKVGKTGRVVSFEPNPPIVAILRENVTASHAGNVIVEPIAATDREEMVTLYAAPVINTGASSLASQNADFSGDGQPPKGYSVRGRPIDDVIRELGLTRVDAVKIDVEGAEVSVLKGAANTLKRFHPKLVIEVRRDLLASFQTTPEDVTSLIKAAGYNHSRPLNPEKDDWEWTAQEPR